MCKSTSLVINYDVPLEKDSYVHRIGRTGRAGNGGRAITLVTGEDIMSLYEIEEHIGAMISEAELPSEAVFNKHRTEAAKWLQANSQKIESPRIASVSNLKETQKKSSYTKSPSHHEGQRNRSTNANTNHNTARKFNTVHTTQQPKPVIANVKPETLQIPHSVAKEPFLKRVLNRILGK